MATDARRLNIALWVVCALGLPATAVAGDEPPGSAARPRAVDYLRDVRPILARHCFACHGADEEHRKGGLRLDTQSGATAPLPSGHVAIVPGDADESDLIFRITEEDDLVRMPPKKTGDRLTPEEIETLTRWVEQGAAYAEHWAFVAPRMSPLPRIENAARARGAIDRWILAGVEGANLTPAADADPATLLRRLSLDLRGLPPTLEEIERFCADPSPAAFERAVDRYLADPAFGERWARVWLDLARYADSAGLGSDPLRPNMWRFRDWVIEAFNRNLPYDQFVVEQLAGDLLPNASLEQRVATAFHRNTMTNTEGGTDDEEFRVAAVKDRVDTTGQVFMGLTFGCAKCHNHKYDPLSMQEYYQLFAFFNQTQDNDQPDERPTLPAPTPAQALEIARLDGKIAGLRRVLNRATPELEASQARWEAALGAAVSWRPLVPREARGENGTSYVIGADGTVSALGPSPEQETILLECEVGASRITAVRLETLPDPALPNGGAGRAGDGNFVLSRVTLETEPAESPRAPVGRVLRIELPGERRLLSLAEIEVFSEGENVARGGRAEQSSTDFGGAAERAIDGNTSGEYFEAMSTTHTRVESNPWWEVRLPEDRPIERIVVWNRTDGALEERLAGFRVILLDGEGRAVWHRDGNEAPRPSLALETTGRWRPSFGGAFADFSQSGFSVEQAIRPEVNPNTGWAVAPQFARRHEAVFTLAQAAEFEQPARLIVRLEHKYKEPQFTLGRFRLSFTADANVPARAAVPRDVLAIIDTPAGSRSEEQRRALAAHYRTIAPELQPVRDEIARLERSKPKPPPLPVMAELSADKRRTTRILRKGNFLDPGQAVSAEFPAYFHAMPEDTPRDRLGLARWIVDPRNTLTARVAVNRIWAQLFGVGLVETEEDFGTQGELPSHPELLDWLALRYQETEWDTKALIRTIVLSSTYRQASRATAEQLARDPRNRLLSRMPRVRLEAELVRDQALALAGLLTRRIGGPSVYPPQPDGLWQAAFNGERTWPTSTGPDRWRRGLYTFWRRTVPYPSMAAFDAPSRETCAVKRVRTNTPLQAFVTLNDPVYVEAAQALARRIHREGGASVESRAAFGLALCLGRSAEPEQVRVVVSLFESEYERLKADDEAARALATDPLGPLPESADAAEFAAWTSVANVLLNLDGVLTKG